MSCRKAHMVRWSAALIVGAVAIHCWLLEARADDTKEIGLMPGVPLAPHDVDRSNKIGIIDSGVRAEHPQIGNALGATRDFTGEGLGDRWGHGTEGVLVYLYSHFKKIPTMLELGISARVPEFEVAKVIGSQRASAQVVADRMTDAVLWLASLGVKLVSISISLPDGAADYSRLCATMGAQDIFFAIAAGNSGEFSIVYPAACNIKHKLVVGASRNRIVEDYSGPADAVEDLADLPMPLSATGYWIAEGTERKGRNDASGARQAWEQGLAANPDTDQTAWLTYNLGVLALNAGEIDQAAKRFEESLRSKPDLPGPYLGLAALATRARQFEAARAALERGIAAGAADADLRGQLARVFLDLDQPRDALTQMDELTRRNLASNDLQWLRLTAENMVKIEDQIAAGVPPLALTDALLKAKSGELVRFVINRWHPDLDAVPPGANVPLLVAAAATEQRGILNLLLTSGARVDARDPKYRLTALMMAAQRGNEPMCRDLLAAKANMELSDYSGFTPLVFAAEAGRATVVKLLLERGAKTTAKSTEGMDALAYARKYHHSDVVALLINAQ
jgi:tetratricopeptide (TPR) repeat protein